MDIFKRDAEEDGKVVALRFQRLEWERAENEKELRSSKVFIRKLFEENIILVHKQMQLAYSYVLFHLAVSL